MAYSGVQIIENPQLAAVFAARVRDEHPNIALTANLSAEWRREPAAVRLEIPMQRY
jgi:hypothetical protein